MSVDLTVPRQAARTRGRPSEGGSLMQVIDYTAVRKYVFGGVVHRLTRWSGMWRPVCDGPSIARGVFLAELHDPVSADERALGPVDCPACMKAGAM